MNWVDRRAHRETLLSHSDEVWNSVRSAVQDACESFNGHYATTQTPVVCKAENGSRLFISRTIVADRVRIFSDIKLHALVAFSGLEITVTYKNGFKAYQITADDESAFVVDKGKRQTPDEVSQSILEPVLYPVFQGQQEL